MSESGLYPPGAENDPRAPWNQPEPVECPDCDGTGYLAKIERPTCPRCEGEGCVDPESIEDDGPDEDDLRDRELDRRMNS